MFHIENEEQFKDFIKSGEVLVDFFATWCGPCKMMSPILEELEDTNQITIPVLKVDVDKLSKIASIYQIQAIPTLILFKDGKPFKKNVGFLNENQILDFLNK